MARIKFYISALFATAAHNKCWVYGTVLTTRNVFKNHLSTHRFNNATSYHSFDVFRVRTQLLLLEGLSRCLFCQWLCRQLIQKKPSALTVRRSSNNPVRNYGHWRNWIKNWCDTA